MLERGRSDGGARLVECDSPRELVQSHDKRVLFRHRVVRDAARMAPIDVKQRAERRFLSLIEDSGLPLPDAVEYGERCVRFMWTEPKVVVVVDLDEFDERDTNNAYIREGITA